MQDTAEAGGFGADGGAVSEVAGRAQQATPKSCSDVGGVQRAAAAVFAQAQIYDVIEWWPEK